MVGAGLTTGRFVKVYIALASRSPYLIEPFEFTSEEFQIEKISERYIEEFDKVLDMFKHFEELFGMRVLGMKATMGRVLETLSLYVTGVALLLQNIDGRMKDAAAVTAASAAAAASNSNNIIDGGAGAGLNTCIAVCKWMNATTTLTVAALSGG